MAPFEELQQLWQGQPELPAARTQDIQRLLRAYGRRQNWINAAKAIVAGSIMTALLWHVRSSRMSIAAVALAMSAAAVVIARDWRNQRAIARGDFSAPSAGFVGQTIDRLLEMRDIRRREFWPMIAALMVAENLMLSGMHRWWLRIPFTLLPLGALEAGLWVRRRRFDHECRPLLEKLRAIQRDLEVRP